MELHAQFAIIKIALFKFEIQIVLSFSISRSLQTLPLVVRD